MDGRLRNKSRTVPLTAGGEMVYARDKNGKKLAVSGPTVPTATTAGYAIGCIFQQSDGVSGTTFYINEGTVASCTFNAITTLASGGTFTGNLTAPTITASTALAATVADSATVGGIIVPQHIEIAFQIPKIATDLVYNCFVARRAYTVTNVTFVPTILQGGAMTVTPVKVTSTTAPVAATTPLTTAAFDGNAGLHTVQNGTLTATGADLALAAGDRLGLVLSTASTVGQSCVVFSLKRS